MSYDRLHTVLNETVKELAGLSGTLNRMVDHHTTEAQHHSVVPEPGDSSPHVPEISGT